VSSQAPTNLKAVLERNAQALRLRPAIGQGTGKTRVRLRDGLTCDIEEGPWKLTAGTAESSGGANEGPDPGMFGRGALGVCLAVGYAMWATRMGVTFQGIEVEVEADYDARGFYGVAEMTPGYLEVRYHVTVQSNSSEKEITRVLDKADAHSPWLDVYRKPQTLTRFVRVVPTTDDS